MPGLLRGVARTAVIAGTASAVSGRVQRRQQGRWAEQDAQAAQAQAYQQLQYSQAAQSAPPAPAAPPSPGPPQESGPALGSEAAQGSGAGQADATISQLRELAAMRDQGILTDAEFQAQKARILGG